MAAHRSANGKVLQIGVTRPEVESAFAPTGDEQTLMNEALSALAEAKLEVAKILNTILRLRHLDPEAYLLISTNEGGWMIVEKVRYEASGKVMA